MSPICYVHDVGPRWTKKDLLEDFANTTDSVIAAGSSTRTDSPQVQCDMSQCRVVRDGERIYERLQL